MPYKDKLKAQAYSKANWKKHYKNNIQKYRDAHKRWREGIRRKVIDFYSKGSMSCECCGESIYEFLTIDHINNDGTKERKVAGGGGHHNYRTIIKKGFPKGYRVLCYNCNCARAKNKEGICPHKRK